MNFFKRILSGVKKSVSFITSPMNRLSGVEDYFDALNLRTYKESLYLFIAISMIRESVSSIPLNLFRIKNADGDVEELIDDPILDLFERPNYKQTQKEFWKLAVSYYLLAGETFWYMERTVPTAVPTAMVNMRPDYVEILLSQDKKEIIGYEFMQANGQSIRIPAEDVLHIKNIDPVNPLRGVGVVQPASTRIITEKEASKYQAATFASQGRPDIAIFTDRDLSEEDADDARLKFNKVFANKNGTQAAFFGEAVKDLKIIGVNPKEMDFIQSQNFLRDDILAALHVPKAMITSDDVNLANSKTARINYLKEAVMPVLDTFIDIINNKLLNQNGEDRFFDYESPVNEDRELLLKEAVELKKAEIITINEARSLMSYEDVADGDVRESGAGSPFTLSMKMRNARLRKKAFLMLKKRPVLVKKFKAIEALTKAYMLEKGVQRGRNSVFNTKELKESYIKAYNQNIDNKAVSFKDHVDIYNQGLYKRIVKQMEDLGINSNNIFDLNTEIIEAKEIFVPLMQDMFKKHGQKIMDNIANGFAQQKASEQFFTADEFLRALENRAEFFILSMLDTDYKQLQTIVVAGLDEGLGVDQIARNLRGYFEDMSVKRAKTIARTETGRLISEATQEAYRQSEFVTGKEWLTARDNKVRDGEGVNNHVMNDGVIVATNGVFPNGEHFPGELTINCRCAIAPAV